MTLLQTLQAWCRAAVARMRGQHARAKGAGEVDLAQRVRLSGEW